MDDNFLIKSPRKQCLIGTKSLHSLSVSAAAITLFIQSKKLSTDQFLLSALYQNVIIKYAKPFTDMRINGNPERYAIKRIKGADGFKIDIHKEIIQIRNTLVAHDDLDHLEPKILQSCIGFEGYSIPLETHVSNKSLLYLDDEIKISRLSDHIVATRNAVSNVLSEDLERFREFVLKYPNEAKKDQKYEKNYGAEKVEIGGTKLNPPDVSSDAFLDVSEPEQFQRKDGYYYHEMKIRKNHVKAETIYLPNGESVVFNPTDKK